MQAIHAFCPFWKKDKKYQIPENTSKTPQMILMMILSSSKRGNTIAATKQQKNIRKDVNLTGFFKSFTRALGLFTHNGAKISNRLPTIKNMIDKDEEERQMKIQKERERIAMLSCNSYFYFIYKNI